MCRYIMDKWFTFQWWWEDTMYGGRFENFVEKFCLGVFFFLMILAGIILSPILILFGIMWFIYAICANALDFIKWFRDKIAISCTCVWIGSMLAFSVGRSYGVNVIIGGIVGLLLGILLEAFRWGLIQSVTASIFEWLRNKVAITLVFTLLGMFFGFVGGTPAGGAIIGFLAGAFFEAVRWCSETENKANWLSLPLPYEEDVSPPTSEWNNGKVRIYEKPWSWRGFQVNKGVREDSLRRDLEVS